MREMLIELYMLLLTSMMLRRERNDGLYRPVTYVIFKMMEEISITLINSLIFSSIVFFPLKLTGDFILFWLLNLTTTSIGIGEHPCHLI